MSLHYSTGTQCEDALNDVGQSQKFGPGSQVHLSVVVNNTVIVTLFDIGSWICPAACSNGSSAYLVELVQVVWSEDTLKVVGLEFGFFGK